MATLAASSMTFHPYITLEDPQAHLPRSPILEFHKGQSIYNQARPSNSICLIIAGTVKVCRVANDGREVVADIYRVDEFFGESVLLGAAHLPEQAIAMENTRIMAWTAVEMEEIVARRPKLAVAIWQILVQRNVDFAQRIESFSLDNVARRLARSLIRLSERLGAPAEDGSVQMAALTHALLAQYVGTSREGVTYHMNYFRKKGYLRYSRKGIVLNRDAFQEWLRHDDSAFRGMRGPLTKAI